MRCGENVRRDRCIFSVRIQGSFASVNETKPEQKEDDQGQQEQDKTSHTSEKGPSEFVSVVPDNIVCPDRQIGGRHIGGEDCPDHALNGEEKRGRSRSIVWRCRCDCGRTTEATANALQAGLRVSCGCQRTEKLQNYNIYVDDTNLRQVFSDTIYKNNTSGSRGVYRSRGLWAANITYKRKKYFLGRYARQEDAIHARQQAEAWIRDDAAELLERLTAQAVQAAI